MQCVQLVQLRVQKDPVGRKRVEDRYTASPTLLEAMRTPVLMQVRLSSAPHLWRFRDFNRRCMHV